MSAIAKALLSAKDQFLSVAPTSILGDRAKVLVVGAMMAMTLGGTLVSTEAKADSSFVQPSSLGRWGEILGNTVGRVAGAAMAGNSATSAIGRVAQNSVTTIGAEMGGNLGRTAVMAPFGGANNGSSTSAGPMPKYEQDHLDKLGTRALFAYYEASNAGPSNTAQGRAAGDRLDQARRMFEVALRGSADRGFDVRAWGDARKVVQQPFGAVPDQRIVELTSQMSARLQAGNGNGNFNGQQGQAGGIPVYQSQPVMQYQPQQVVQNAVVYQGAAGNSLSSLRESLRSQGINTTPVPGNN